MERKPKEIKDNRNVNLMEDDNITYKDVLIKNIHIEYDPYNNDQFAPFIIVAILHDCVNNRLFVNSYKLVINPLCLFSFLQFNNGKFTETITNRREHDTKLAFVLNQKHFYSQSKYY